MATRTKKRENRVANTLDVVKGTAKDINQFALETTDDVVEAMISSTSQWQGVTAKAVKGGFKLASNQQDIVFNTLETMKGQMIETRKRLRHLFSTN